MRKLAKKDFKNNALPMSFNELKIDNYSDFSVTVYLIKKKAVIIPPKEYGEFGENIVFNIVVYKNIYEEKFCDIILVDQKKDDLL